MLLINLVVKAVQKNSLRMAKSVLQEDSMMTASEVSVVRDASAVTGSAGAKGVNEATDLTVASVLVTGKESHSAADALPASIMKRDHLLQRNINSKIIDSEEY